MRRRGSMLALRSELPSGVSIIWKVTSFSLEDSLFLHIPFQLLFFGMERFLQGICYCLESTENQLCISILGKPSQPLLFPVMESTLHLER